MRTVIAGLLLLGASTSVSGQWLKIKTPGIPRKADGKPNLTAPAPRASNGKPDLSGLWMTETNTYWINITGDLNPGEIRPWAEAVYKKRVDDLDRDTPAAHCLPLGPPEILAGGQYRIMQAPNMIAILYEGGAYRQVFLDGRGLPKDPNPTWAGYSVGHWEGDVLVVETAGFNDRTWLDYGGHPHSEDLHVIERFRRRDFGHMQLEMTFIDPKTFAKPIEVKLAVDYVPDTEMLEFVCNENERDSRHLVGKASDEVKGQGQVDAAVLSRYTGNYQEHDSPDEMRATIKVTGGQLIFSLAGKGGIPLTTLSETKFYFPGGFPIDFVRDNKGAANHFLLHTAEGDLKFERQP
ncbi:MAG: hypothetical protein C5B51_25945 [Terriglobia bacterium]|nr:MAG: hypothetical protein C5B51_25945 [Terriglobia bacterium]